MSDWIKFDKDDKSTWPPANTSGLAVCGNGFMQSFSHMEIKNLMTNETHNWINPEILIQEITHWMPLPELPNE